MDDTLARLQSILRDVFDNPNLAVTAESSSRNVDGWDSLAHINLIMAVEQDFHIRFALEDLARVRNVGDMAETIDLKIRGRNSP